MRSSSNPKTASTSRRAHPHLPPHVLEHHRKVLATILKKRLMIEQWRTHVGGEVAPSSSSKARPTYQSRLNQEFSELRSALPDRLKPTVQDRVTIMANATSYIVYLKNSLHQFRGEATEGAPTYIAPRTFDNMTSLQAKTHKENCMIRMLTQVLPTISVMPSKIQLIEHATQTIHKLEIEYYHLLQSARQADAAISSPPSSSCAPSRRALAPETETLSEGSDCGPLPSIRSMRRLPVAISSASSTSSMSCPATPVDLEVDMDVEVQTTSSSRCERLPSIREILRSKTVFTDLRLPPLRFTNL